jgi:hypothetical protein
MMAQCAQEIGSSCMGLGNSPIEKGVVLGLVDGCAHRDAVKSMTGFEDYWAARRID